MLKCFARIQAGQTLKESRNVAVRGLIVSSCVARQSPSTRKVAMPTSTGRNRDAASRGNGQSMYNNKGKLPNRQGPAPAPSTITAEAVLAKLLGHIKTAWVRADTSIQSLAIDLGIDRTRFKVLATSFGKQAAKELEAAQGARITSIESLGWDGEALRIAYVSEGAASLRNAALGAMIRWSAQQPLVRKVAEGSSVGTVDMAVLKLQQLAAAADRRYASETYPSARQLRRKIILHVGPTNSGKTHQALVALARARTGVYAGPLRLLAHEVFSRFNEGKIGDEGKRVCNLITGEEQRIIDKEAGLSSCTIEMYPMAKRLDVGVIDEIQMIGDPGRGTAWTQAILGSNCAELHLCGEESVVELIQTIAKELGDECIVNRYSRLSPLVVAQRSLGSDLSKIRPGDCLVTFSRSNIFAFKRTVEEKTGLRVAVAYGGLPPEVREEQARVFNEGGYDVLVASDAVGMGLNLKIKRIVFESMYKWNGTQEIRLPTPQIKQIAGRAGRYGVHTSPTAPDDASATATTTNGEATTLDEADMAILREAMAEPTVQVTQASLAATYEASRDVEALLPIGTPFSKIFALVEAMAQTTPHYRCVGHSGWGEISDKISHIEPLSFKERYLFGTAPVNLRDPKVVATLISFVESFAAGKTILMEEWAEDADVYASLDRVESTRRTKKQGGNRAIATDAAAVYNPEFLMGLESSHRCLTLYLWLSYRQSTIFCDREAARLLRKRIENGIDFVLSGMKFSKLERGSKAKRYKSKMSKPEDMPVFDVMGRYNKPYARGSLNTM